MKATSPRGRCAADLEAFLGGLEVAQQLVVLTLQLGDPGATKQTSSWSVDTRVGSSEHLRVWAAKLYMCAQQSAATGSALAHYSTLSIEWIVGYCLQSYVSNSIFAETAISTCLTSFPPAPV